MLLTGFEDLLDMFAEGLELRDHHFSDQSFIDQVDVIHYHSGME